MPSSVAAACSSKSKARQICLRSAIPHARVIPAPKGACTTICIPPDSSKNRSTTTRRFVGTAPSTRSPSAMYSTACSAASCGAPHSSTSHATPSPVSCRAASSSRSADTSSESSPVRPGASPSQNGSVGLLPCASSTRTRPLSTRRIFHGVFPSRKTSPATLSTAKSSCTVPTNVPSGSAMTS